MARTLHERQRSALSSSARLVDCRAVLADTEAESSRLLSEAMTASSRATDPDVELGAARQARNEHADLVHQSERADAIAVRLRQKVEQLQDDEVTGAKLRDYGKALKERDALVEAIRTEYPAVLGTLIPILLRLRANDAAVQRVNTSLPKGKPPIADAEPMARELVSMLGGMGGQPLSLLRLRLPNPTGTDMAWPMPQTNMVAPAVCWGDMVAQVELGVLPKWAHVRLTHQTGQSIEFNCRVGTTDRTDGRYVDNRGWTGWVPISEAERLEGVRGLTVERLAS